MKPKVSRRLGVGEEAAYYRARARGPRYDAGLSSGVGLAAAAESKQYDEFAGPTNKEEGTSTPFGSPARHRDFCEMNLLPCVTVVKNRAAIPIWKQNSGSWWFICCRRGKTKNQKKDSRGLAADTGRDGKIPCTHRRKVDAIAWSGSRKSQISV